MVPLIGPTVLPQPRLLDELAFPLADFVARMPRGAAAVDGRAPRLRRDVQRNTHALQLGEECCSVLAFTRAERDMTHGAEIERVKHIARRSAVPSACVSVASTTKPSPFSVSACPCSRAQPVCPWRCGRGVHR